MKNNYDFKALRYLERNMNYIIRNKTIKYINLCAYKIIKETMYPFILYLFFKSNNNSMMVPRINIENFDYDDEAMIDFIKKGILNEMGKSNQDNILYHGCHVYKEELYVFLDITNINTHHSAETKYNFVLINEILNGTSGIYKIIDMNVDFFTNNVEYGLLYDIYGKQYDTPVVGYIGSTKQELDYFLNVGIVKERNLFGEAYYFTNYENSINSSECIIRIAVFLGDMCLKENYPEDNYDVFFYKYSKDNNLSRISDYSELWKKKYDSVYVGRIELDNGEEFLKGPLYAFKKYEQHLPLSYEYVNIK